MGGGRGNLNLDGIITPLPSLPSMGDVTKIRVLPPFLQSALAISEWQGIVSWEAIKPHLLHKVQF
jgi:hypothetical protein